MIGYKFDNKYHSLPFEICITIRSVDPSTETVFRNEAEQAGFKIHEYDLPEGTDGKTAAIRAIDIIEGKEGYYKKREYLGSFEAKYFWEDAYGSAFEKKSNVFGECKQLIDQYGTQSRYAGETYEVGYAFLYMPQKAKIIYYFYEQKIKDAENNVVEDQTNGDKSENFKESVGNLSSAFKELEIGLFREDVEVRTPTEFIDVLDNIDKYIPIISNKGTEELSNKVSVILTLITNIGMILSVLMSAFLGVKYMLASLEEKADYKKDMIPYLIGACLLFGICSIVKLMQAIGNSINNL